MVLIPAVDNRINTLISTLDETEAKIDFMTSNLNILGSNADVFANSVFNTSNITGMYNYLKTSSNELRQIEIPASSNE